MIQLFIANTITDLILGDINEHISIDQIDLTGDILGLGTTTALDNGELSFIYDPTKQDTAIYKCNSSDGTVTKLNPRDDISQFPYVCYTNNAQGKGQEIPVNSLPNAPNTPLAAILESAIKMANTDADIYGLRLQAKWHSLVVTVASKLCLWQGRRWGQQGNSDNVYQTLKHYKFGSYPDSNTNIQYLGDSLTWDICGFYAKHPERGLVTVPRAGQNLHIHGCSVDLKYGGHLHHEHPETALAEITRLLIYPIHQVITFQSDLTLKDCEINVDSLTFIVDNQGRLDVNDVDIDIVVNNQYNTKKFIRLPWLKSGESIILEVGLDELSLEEGENKIEIIIDPNNLILESAESNNRAVLTWPR